MNKNGIKLLALNTFLVFINYGFLYGFIRNINVIAFLLLLYMGPIVINSLLLIIYIRKTIEKPLLYIVLNSVQSVFAYCIFAFFFEKLEFFKQFIALNKRTVGNMTIEFSSSIFDINQIIFVAVLFFSIQFLVYRVLSKGSSSK